MEYHKLVRDLIPEIMAAHGETAVTRILNEDEYQECLEKKLDEEVAEYHGSRDIEELADILEVVCALCRAQGHTVDELMEIYQKKHDGRGGFEKKIFLIRKE